MVDLIMWICEIELANFVLLLLWFSRSRSVATNNIKLILTKRVMPEYYFQVVIVFM